MVVVYLQHSVQIGFYNAERRQPGDRKREGLVTGKGNKANTRNRNSELTGYDSPRRQNYFLMPFVITSLSLHFCFSPFSSCLACFPHARVLGEQDGT